MAREELADTLMVDQVVIDDFDAAYCLGLIGAIWKQEDTELVLSQFLEAGKPVRSYPEWASIFRHAARQMAC
ncbi:hypothetical protein [Rhizobium sp. BR 315]|uniref:hypothetical protein n=1 Tax=Rhizobium sp. BR 315 TaxID=3040014 RepID=UPI003D3323C3